MGGEGRIGTCAEENRGAKTCASLAVACLLTDPRRGLEGVRAGDSPSPNTGVRCSGDASKPGGRAGSSTPTREAGDTMARARLAPVDAEATGERESRSWAPSALVIVSDAGAASFAAAKEGITEVGEEGGSGVVGGVRPARERRLLERGEGDRARPRPRRTGPARS
jgi:hypothetical protein